MTFYVGDQRHVVRVVGFINFRAVPVCVEKVELMKRFVIAAALYPVSVITGWFFTKLSERFEAALDEIDYELGLDD